MSLLATFDRELTQRDGDSENTWYDDGIVFVGQLAAELTEADLTALVELWPQRPARWQKHCAEVLDKARHVQAIQLLLDMVNRAAPEVSLAALESLGEFDPALFAEDQRQRILDALRSMQARPVSQLHQVVLNTFRVKLRDEFSEGS